MEEIKNFEDNAAKFADDMPDMAYGSHQTIEPEAEAPGTVESTGDAPDAQRTEPGLLAFVDTLYEEGDVLW